MQYPKRQPYRNKKITKAARDESCTLKMNGCTGGGADTVYAHSNYGEDGKGMSQKADDCFGCFACSNCHAVLDGHKMHSYTSDDLRYYFHRAMKTTWRRLLDKGILK
jgi:hypothetical protein